MAGDRARGDRAGHRRELPPRVDEAPEEGRQPIEAWLGRRDEVGVDVLPDVREPDGAADFGCAALRDAVGVSAVLAGATRAWDVSWGGSSPWEHLNYLPVSFSDVRVGDFNGDGVSDVFFASGREWFISWGGRGAWTHFALAIHRARDLLFADFNRDGKTDVFGIDGGSWKYVPGGSSTWVWLRSSPTGTSITQLRAGDFDGDGYADVARASNGVWELSPAGTGALGALWSSVPGGFSWATHLGRFAGGARVEMLSWIDDRQLGRVWKGATGLQPWTMIDVHAH